MRIFKERASLTAYLEALRSQGKTIGFVPTMGALHEGHLSLLRAAGEKSDVVVCSIFVNPTQFNDPQDFKKYPIRTGADIRQLMATPVDLLFLPSAAEIYQHGTDRLATFDFGRVETLLEGASRPGHFQGVGQVLEQLLATIPADFLFMGEKDYQQLLITKRLLTLLHIKTELIPCPILREADGLAMSSRNQRLSETGRKTAPALYRALRFVKENPENLSFPELTARAASRLEKDGFRVAYVSIAGAADLEPLSGPIPGKMICLAAAWLDGVRLIDNLPLN